MSDDLLINSTIFIVDRPENSYPVTYYFVPFYAIVFFIGTFGNGLVLISIVRSVRLRTVTNTYLLNIAIADFLLLLSIPFLIMTIFANGWIFGNILCKMYFNFIHINQYVGSLLLAALSFDRYLAVCHPVRAIQFRTRTNCALIIGGCWLVSILFLCPTWAFATATSDRFYTWFGYQVQRCVIDFPAILFTIPPEIVFIYYAFFLGFLIPVSMITTFYILVLIRLHHIRRKHRSESKQRSHRKVTRIVLAVITAYFICWVPYWFLQIFITIDPLLDSLQIEFSILPANTSMPFLKELTHLTTIIGYANNCLNPLLYVFLSESFREEYLLVLNCLHPGGMNRNNVPMDEHHQQQQRENKSNEYQRRSFYQRKRREIQLKKAKHSVAIDDGPSDYRTHSLRIHRPTDRKRHSSSSMPVKVTTSELRNLNHSTSAPLSSISRKKSSNEQLEFSSKKNLTVKTTIDHPQFCKSFVDDGGVYCGD